MSSPREAIYDVLVARRQRALDARQPDALKTEWEQYEAANAAANASYRGATAPKPQTAQDAS